MFKDVIEAKTYSLGGVDFTVVVVDRGVCETMLAAARDMLALGEAYRKYTLDDTVQADYDRQLFKYTAANLAQKWGEK